MSTILAIGCIILVGVSGTTTFTGPLQKVVELLTNLEDKVNKQAAAAAATHQEYVAWCKERSSNLGYEIKTGKAQVEDLTAAIEQASTSMGVLATKIEETNVQTVADEGDLKAAMEIRAKEKADFILEEQELLEIIDTLQRAVGILQKEKGSAAMLQLEKARSITHAFGIMVEASMILAKDAAKLTSLIQNSQQDDKAWGAPAAAIYESHSNNILETLDDLLETAQSQHAEARGKETAAIHNFEMLKQSLENSIKYAGQELAEAKAANALQTSSKSMAEGDLAVTKKTLTGGENTLSTLQTDCTTEAENFAAETASRNEELAALAEGKKVIVEMTSGAGALSYNRQASFVQVSQSGLRTSFDLVNFEVAQFVRKLAQQQHSEVLAQLSRRIASAIDGGMTTGNDSFSKVKSMIADLIEHLQKDATADASHKAYCDKELGDTLEKSSNKKVVLAKLSAHIDTMTARSAKLNDEVVELQKALAALAKTTADMTALRQTQNKQYVANKVDMEDGLEGVKLALKRLREYYASEDKAHRAEAGSATGIIGLLEVIESDFTKTFAEMTAAETSSEANFDQEIQENEVERTAKEKDVEYKNREVAQLKSSIAESSSDHKGAQSELDALLEYNGELLKMCEEKPETYGGRKERRDAEIAGLKEALSILEGETALIQGGGMTHHHGGLRHAKLAPI